MCPMMSDEAVIKDGRRFVEDLVLLLAARGGVKDVVAARGWLLQEVLDLTNNCSRCSLGALLDDDIRAGALVELTRDTLRTI